MAAFSGGGKALPLQAGLSHGRARRGWSSFLDLGGRKEKQTFSAWLGGGPGKFIFILASPSL